MLNGIDTEALAATQEAVRENPALAQVTFNLASKWQSGCAQEGTTGDVLQDGKLVESRTARYTFTSDEPEALLGTDKGANPGEFVLQALAGCYAVTFAANAAAKGITLDSLACELAVDFDLQGFLGTDTSVRPGAQAVRVQVRATSPDASDDQLAEITRLVERRSPIRDTLASAIPVTTEFVGK